MNSSEGQEEKPGSTYPGQIQFTLIPLAAHSLLIAFVICNTPPFVHAYAAMLIFPMKEMMEAMLIILPGRFSSSNRLPISCAATKDALRLIWKTYVTKLATLLPTFRKILFSRSSVQESVRPYRIDVLIREVLDLGPSVDPRAVQKDIRRDTTFPDLREALP